MAGCGGQAEAGSPSTEARQHTLVRPADLSSYPDAELDAQIATMEKTKTLEATAEERRQKEAKLREIELELLGMWVAAKRLTLETSITQAAVCGAAGPGDELLRPGTPGGTGFIEGY